MARVQTESKRGQFRRLVLHLSDAVSTLEWNATGPSITYGGVLFAVSVLVPVGLSEQTKVSVGEM